MSEAAVLKNKTKMINTIEANETLLDTFNPTVMTLTVYSIKFTISNHLSSLMSPLLSGIPSS
jgi:hypothetical protein